MVCWRAEVRGRRVFALLVGSVAALACLANANARAQAMNTLDDFQFNPFADPPRAQFWFRRPPAFEQSETGADERVLTLVYPYTSNEATQAKYLRHFPEAYPLKSLEVSERDGEEGESLIVRFTLRRGYAARLSQSPRSATMTVMFTESAPQSAAVKPPKRAPKPTPKTAPTAKPSPPKPAVTATASKPSTTTPVEPPKTAAAKPSPTPPKTADGDQPKSADAAKPAESPKTDAPTPDNDPPITESLGRFFVPILVVAGGIIILVVALVGGGFVLVWSWASLRTAADRRRAAATRKVFETAREMNRVLEQFRSSSEETLQDATERHRTTLETLRRDTSAVRDSVAELIAEFERATQSVALMGSAFGARPPLVDASTDARPKAEPAPAAAEERRRSVRDWITRVSARVAEEDVGGTQAETLARRVEGTRVDPAELLAPVEPEYSEPPAEEPELLDEADTEPAPVEETNLYDKARTALANGATPIEVARRTGLSLGEVELIAQLERARKEPKY